MKLQTFFFFFLFASTATTGSAIWWDIFEKDEENECDSEHDCTHKEFCDKDNEPRTCVPKRENGEQCSRDAKCLSDKCVNNVCKAQHHQPNNNKDKCHKDDDCEKHEFCDKDNAPRECKPKRKEGEQCSRDAKCLSDKCVDNVCKAPHHDDETCHKDHDCKDYEFCSNNKCSDKRANGEKCSRTKSGTEQKDIASIVPT